MGNQQFRVRSSEFKVQNFKSLVSGFWSKVQSPESEPQPTGYWLLATDYRSRGFTLIEIMVVVFILGLLVTLVAPKIMGTNGRGQADESCG